MQISKELLSEDQYTGKRLIPIKSYQVHKLKKEVDKIAKSAEPILDEMDKIVANGLNDFQAKIQEHQRAIKALQTDPKFAELSEQYQVLLKRVELKDNRSQLVKNKMQPLVDEELQGQLGEFEKPVTLITDPKTGKIFVEVVDEIEEFIKSKRAKNAPSKSV